MQELRGKIEVEARGVISTFSPLTDTIFSEENSVAKNNISKICSVEGCPNSHWARSFCVKHYSAFRRTSSFCTVRNFGQGQTREDKFWSKVDKSPGQGPNGDCWEWQGARHCKDLYGQTSYQNKLIRAHILAWILVKGFIPQQWLLHSCDNPPCVNPLHLREGTPKDNTDDRDSRGRAATGEKAGRAKLTAAQVREIRGRCLDSGRSNRGANSQLALAKEFGVARSTIQAIINRESWRCLPSR